MKTKMKESCLKELRKINKSLAYETLIRRDFIERSIKSYLRRTPFDGIILKKELEEVLSLVRVGNIDEKTIISFIPTF